MQSKKLASVRQVTLGAFGVLGLIAIGVFLWMEGLERAGQWSSIISMVVGVASFVLAWCLGVKTLKSVTGKKVGDLDRRTQENYSMYNEKPGIVIGKVENSKLSLDFTLDGFTAGDK